MIRPIFLVSAAAAALTLAACDQPSVLAKAQTGECYKVTGKSGSLAQPVMAKVACADDAAATASTTEAGSSAVCPKSCAGSGSGAGAGNEQASADEEGEGSEATASGSRSYLSHSSVRTSKAYRSGWGRHSRTTRGTRSGAYQVNEGLSIEYARASDSDKYGQASSQKGVGYIQTDQSSSNGAYDASSRETLRRGYSEQSSTAYSSSSSSSSSGSASGYSYSSGSGSGSSSGAALAGGPCCTAAYPVRGPHSPFDRNGFLTWPGKPDYDPRN